MKTWMKLAIGLGVVTLLTPLGILAKGSAWGEQSLVTLWHAKLSGYAFRSGQSTLGYLISAVIGVALIVGITWVLGRLLAKGKQNAS